VEVLRPQHRLVLLGQLGQYAGHLLGPLAPPGALLCGAVVDQAHPAAPAVAAEVVARQPGGDAAQPAGETSLGRVERGEAAHGRQPGVLRQLVGVIAQAAAAPQDVGVQAVAALVVPLAPGLLVASQDRLAQAALAPDALGRFHDASAWWALPLLLSPG